MFPLYSVEAVHSLQPLHGLTDDDNVINTHDSNNNSSNDIGSDDNDGLRSFKDLNSSYFSQNMNFNPMNSSNIGKTHVSVNQLISPAIPHPVALPYIPSPYFTSFTPTQTPTLLHNSETHLGAI